VSRLPRAGEAAKPVTVRATPAEREQWERAATTEGCATLSAWIVRSLNRRAVHQAARAREEKAK
jgi:uncharacterized protein (DUF1778 family)